MSSSAARSIISSADAYGARNPTCLPSYQEQGQLLAGAVAKAEEAIAAVQASREYNAEGIRTRRQLAIEGASSAFATVRQHQSTVEQRIAEMRNKWLALPQGDPAIQREIRDVMRGMTATEREIFLKSTTDVEVICALVNGPKAFPLVSEKALALAREQYAGTAYPSLTEELRSLETYHRDLALLLDFAQRRLKELQA
jgi:hypothetical protein